jgi:hypothetical protein
MARQDEFLDPAHHRSYHDYLVEAEESRIDWIEFRNFNYWWTDGTTPFRDDPARAPLCAEDRCPPRIALARASPTFGTDTTRSGMPRCAPSTSATTRCDRPSDEGTGAARSRGAGAAT